MNNLNTVFKFPSGQGLLRDDFVPKDAYLSREFASLEAQRLWPRTWQVACRAEELPKVGDYLTYDILDDSILLVRTAADQIKAFHNVCQHRGRRLADGTGRTNAFMCRFHGWTWKLDGSLAKVLAREDWEGCADMDDENIRLKDVRVDTWGGFVFINMDPSAEPLAKYLDPMPGYINCYEFEKMRYRWNKSIRIPCNWKVAIEAFNEGYHVAATHPQFLEVAGEDETRSSAMGKHGMFGYPTSKRPLGAPSPRTGKPMLDDLRPGLVAFFQQMEDTLKAIFTHRGNAAVKRLMAEVPKDAAPMEVFAIGLEFQREAAIAEGAGWPEVTLEQMGKAGTDWHIFPNLVFLMWPDGALVYRARPDGNNPDSCIFDVWSLVRYAPGKEPPLKRERYLGPDDWKTDVVERFGLVLSQDFQNMGEVQRGMRSRGFVG